MAIQQQIETDLTTALKAKDEAAVLALRGLKTALNNAEIANNREPLTDDGVIKLLRTEVKKRKESQELYEKGGRTELAEKEAKEIELIEKYLPAQLSEEAVKKVVDEVVAELGASGPQDMGKVMGPVMAKLAGQADGGLVNRLVKEALS